MKIEINRVNDAVHLIAKNEDGLTVSMDGSPEIGGENLGVRPMQLLLMSMGGCSSMDVLSILKKMQQDITHYKVVVDGNREPDKVPSLFTDVNIHFEFKGNNLDPIKVKRAIDLSIEKYCSVSKTLEPTANITSSFEILA